MRIEENREIRAEAGTMITETRVLRIISNRGRIGITTTRERRVIRQQGILANKLQGTTVLQTQLELSVGKITQGNADRGLLYVTSAVKKGITLGGVQLRLQVMIGRTRIKNRNLGH